VIELYYEPDEIRDTPENRRLRNGGLRRIIEAISALGIEHKLIDVSGRRADELQTLYVELAVTPSVYRGYRIRRIFGTNKYAGCFFGRGVPALIVRGRGRPQDVFPHEKQDGSIVTINDFVESLKPVSRGAELAKRMDALRARIGPVGATTRELIEEGRRR
jgi:hypothetical protein